MANPKPTQTTEFINQQSKTQSVVPLSSRPRNIRFTALQEEAFSEIDDVSKFVRSAVDAAFGIIDYNDGHPVMTPDVIERYKKTAKRHPEYPDHVLIATEYDYGEEFAGIDTISGFPGVCVDPTVLGDFDYAIEIDQDPDQKMDIHGEPMEDENGYPVPNEGSVDEPFKTRHYINETSLEEFLIHKKDGVYHGCFFRQKKQDIDINS